MIRNIVAILREHKEIDSPLIAQAKGINKFPSSVKETLKHIKLKYKYANNE